MSDNRRKKIFQAITKVLETQFDSEKLDHLLTDAVVLVVSDDSKIPVAYIGFRSEYEDSNYGTGRWVKEQVKLIDPKTAEKMFKHPDVYVPGDEEKVSEVVRTDPPEPKKDDDPSLEEGRESVRSMGTKKQVVEFVARNFNDLKLEMPAKARLQDFKDEAIRLIDKYQLP